MLFNPFALSSFLPLQLLCLGLWFLCSVFLPFLNCGDQTCLSPQILAQSCSCPYMWKEGDNRTGKVAGRCFFPTDAGDLC